MGFLTTTDRRTGWFWIGLATLMLLPSHCLAAGPWQGFGWQMPTNQPKPAPARPTAFDQDAPSADWSTGFGYAPKQSAGADRVQKASFTAEPQSNQAADIGSWPQEPMLEAPIAAAPHGSGGFGYAAPGRAVLGVDQSTKHRPGREPRFRNAQQIPFEQYGYGEYLGPHRTPHVPEYRLRVDDELEFVYTRTREKTLHSYRLYVGDTIEVTSAIDPTLNQEELVIRSDGRTSFSLIGQVMCAGKTIDELQGELNQRYQRFVRNPSIVVQVRQGDTPLNDIVDSVDARQGQGGQSRQTSVSPDGTVQLPVIGSVPAVGLTLKEIAREVNARYRMRMGGIEVTPILLEVAPRYVYVVGEVTQPGRFELTGPTSVMQAIALAEGFESGGNIRQVIIFRRDQNWQLTATKLDLGGALLGKRPLPADEIWLRDSDIVLIPKKPIQRFSEAVNQYFSNTLYSIFPVQGVAFNFDNFTPL